MGPVTATNGPASIAPGAGKALALLLAINLFNYIDRQILSATLPKIQLDAGIFRPDDPNMGFKLGLLTTGFLVSYMLLSPLFGWFGDRASRWLLVGAAVIAWSLATGGTGLAATYGILLLTRCLVGVGEAAYGPVAPSMLADLYPVDHRGRIMSWFYMAIPVGSALGFVIGGTVAGTSLGWRGAFLVVVLPGLILGALCFFMKEPRKVATNPEHAPRYLTVLRELRGIRSFLFCCAGMTLSTFVLGGVAAWAPVYIFEREARFAFTPEMHDKLQELKQSDGSPVIPAKVLSDVQALIGPDVFPVTEYRAKLLTKLSLSELKQYGSHIDNAATAPGSLTTGKIGLFFGGVVVVSGLFATLLGGVLGDRFRNRGVRGAYFLVAGWSTVLAFPFFLGMLFTPFPLAWVFMFLAVFCLFVNTGPANTILANVTRPQIRATAFAINILVIHALGDAISPPLIGATRDAINLHTAFLATSFLIPAAGLLWVFGARYLDEDTRRIEGPLQAIPEGTSLDTR
jgi:MFS transporter, Spinster family, sphingosine-1-phosphate transporter